MYSFSTCVMFVADEYELQDIESDHDSYLSTHRDGGMWVDASGIVFCLTVPYLR